MLKASLIGMFILSLATLTFASSLLPVQASASEDLVQVATTQPHVWIETFE